MSSKNRLVLLGFSGSVLSLIFNTLRDSRRMDAVMIVENIKTDDEVAFEAGIPFTRVWHADYRKQPGDTFAFSMMTPAVKQIVFEFFRSQFGIEADEYKVIKHPSVVASDSCVLGKGIYIEPGCIISPYARLGFGVSVNRGSTIGHHADIGDFVTINPGVHIAGHCSIGRGTTIGIGSSVFDHVKIGAGSQIGGGSIVNKDIPDGVVAFGNPCKVIKDAGR